MLGVMRSAGYKQITIKVYAVIIVKIKFLEQKLNEQNLLYKIPPPSSPHTLDVE